MSKIQDGTGENVYAKVNENKRLYTSAITQTASSASNTIGDAYNVNTGIIELTDAVDTPVIYLKNNETTSLYISAIAVGIGPSTGGSGGIPKITIIRNPTAGTIISGATAVDINSNRNYGSQKTLSVNAYKGATGNTMTGGDDHIIFFQTTNGRLFATIEEILPKGSSIGVKIAPQTGNTSMQTYCAFICNLTDPKE